MVGCTTSPIHQGDTLEDLLDASESTWSDELPQAPSPPPRELTLSGAAFIEVGTTQRLTVSGAEPGSTVRVIAGVFSEDYMCPEDVPSGVDVVLPDCVDIQLRSASGTKTHILLPAALADGEGVAVFDVTIPDSARARLAMAAGVHFQALQWGDPGGISSATAIALCDNSDGDPATDCPSTGTGTTTSGTGEVCEDDPDWVDDLYGVYSCDELASAIAVYVDYTEEICAEWERLGFGVYDGCPALCGLCEDVTTTISTTTTTTTPTTTTPTTDTAPDTCREVGGVTSWAGDGRCDLDNNNEACDFDGGDCCPGDCAAGPYGESCEDHGGACWTCVDPDSPDLAEGGACFGDVCEDDALWYTYLPHTAGHMFKADCGVIGSYLAAYASYYDVTSVADMCVIADDEGWYGAYLLEACAATCGLCETTGTTTTSTTTPTGTGTTTTPTTTGPPPPTCSDVYGSEDYIGDGYCDSNNNNAACAYDGGDCCPSDCDPDSIYGCDVYGSYYSYYSYSSYYSTYYDYRPSCEVCLDPESVDNLPGGECYE